MADGVDHINIYSKGATELGRSLSNFSAHGINTIDGYFASLEGYWYWLGVDAANPRREDLRDATLWRAKELGRELRGADWGDTGQFKLRIVAAMVNKLLLHPSIYEQFAASVLPFDHYYVYGDKKVRPDNGKWIIETWEYLRKLLHA